MTDKDKEEIAAIFTNVLKNSVPACPNGIDAATAATLKEFADYLKEGKKTFRKTVITALVTTILGAILIGIKEFFNKP